MKKIFYLVLLLFILTSCDNYMKLKIKFDKETEIMPRSFVMLEDTIIGTVEKVESDGKSTIVSILVQSKYRKRMNTKTMFFRVKEKNNEKIVVFFNDKDDASPLVDGQIVEGMGEFMYHILRTVKGVSNKIHKFFSSEEWNEFKGKITDKISKVYKKTEEEFEEEKIKLKDDIDIFIKEMNEKYGKEIGEKIKEFSDSLFKEKDKND
ncbi:MAG: hypothetical protein COX48_01790 [bacterium (Candidatus Stahlbacteria) CG23_combo_of_CG06-09_8_20_14_all_34_7]|nr:MAG: hypothetical protein COX48_01790 [bacterium (Candidatus Stahlbacteria) CG23_combo_of_CG06-09_8_20_14_all_34_7]